MKNVYSLFSCYDELALILLILEFTFQKINHDSGFIW